MKRYAKTKSLDISSSRMQMQNVYAYAEKEGACNYLMYEITKKSTYPIENGICR